MALDPQQIKAIETASGHSVFGGSSLPRIVECPASVMMELRAGLKPSTVYASKGSELHSITEKALRHRDPHKYIHSLDISIEDMVYVLDAVDYVLNVLEKHPEGATMKLESEGNLSSYGIPECYGTMDVVIQSELQTDIIDHKFGHGVSVYAERNYQLVAYLGMAVPFVSAPDKDHKLFVHINQPPKNIYDEWEVSWEVLYQMLLGDVTDAIAKAKGDDPPFGPSTKACRFCNANMMCKARHNSLVGQAKLVQQMARNPAQVPNEKWAEFLDASTALKEAISHVEKYAIEEIQRGHDFPGFKLVGSRSNRKFVDETSANEYMVKRLGKRAYKEPSYITLAQAEKIDKSLKDDETWNGMIFKPQGAPKLVRASDKGEVLVYGVRGIMNEIAQGNV